MMPNGDPWDGFFYPTLTLMIDSYILTQSVEALSIARSELLYTTLTLMIDSYILTQSVEALSIARSELLGDQKSSMKSIINNCRDVFVSRKKWNPSFLWDLNSAMWLIKVRKRAKIRNRYNQAPHLTQNTNGKVTTSQ